MYMCVYFYIFINSIYVYIIFMYIKIDNRYMDR